jgi:hypothetical protein
MSGPEPSRALLVHLGAGSHAVHSHEEELLGLDLAKEVLDVIEDGDKDLLVGDSIMRVVAVGVGTIVNDWQKATSQVRERGEREG